MLPDAPLQSGDVLVQALAEVAERLAVHEKARLFHLRQHPAERKLRRLIQPRHAQFFQFYPQHRLQQPDRLGAAAVTPQIARRDALEGIVASRGVEQIGGQCRIESKAVDGQTFRQKQRHQLLHMVGALLFLRAEDLTQELVISLTAARPSELIDPLAVADFDPLQPVQRQYGKPFRLLDRRAQRGDLVLALHRGALHGRGFALRNTLLRRGQAPFLDKPVEAEPLHHAVEFRLVVMVPQVVRGPEIERDLPEDRSEPEGLSCALLAVGKLFAEAVADIERVQIGVDRVDRVILSDQLQRGLLAHAGNARDVIGAVAHQGLEVYHADWREAVFGVKALRRIEDGLRLAHAGFDVAYRSLITHELQAVLVAGDNDAVPALVFTDRGGGAQDIVRLVALELVAADAHVVEYFLQDRHLYSQLVRHGLALGLISLIGLMPEGRRLQIEADAERVRLLLVQQALQDRQKAVNRVGGRAVGRVELPHTEKGAVDDAVAVQDH